MKKPEKAVMVVVVMMTMRLGETLIAYHMINLSPFGKTPEIMVIDIKIGTEFAGRQPPREKRIRRGIGIHGIELQTATPAEFDGLFEKFAFTDRPQHYPVSLGSKSAEHVYCKRFFLTNGGIAVIDNRSVEIYSDEHINIF